MLKSIVQMLELSASKYPEKPIFIEQKREISYHDFVIEAKRIGSSLLQMKKRNQPIAIFLDKGISCLASMVGTAYSGNFYTILDVKMPKDRIQTICNTLNPIAIITDQQSLAKAKELGFAQDIFIYEEMLQTEIDASALDRIQARMIDTDPIYALFTSGSTGVPKGTVINHRSVISYAHWVCETFDINEKTVYGNQTPFYFSMSVLDIFSTLHSGATLCIIPKMFFSFPVKLMQYLNEKKINTIYWVPSALSIVANLKTFDTILPENIEKVLFAGEVMPVKQLNIWMNHIPNALYANLYGPTEITDICTYYVVNRTFADDESLPIGNSCNNCDVLIIKEDGTEASDNESGELCVRGSFLAAGYYNNPEKTAEVFVQNPLQPHYPELIYKTGDIVKYNEYGELLYLSRKDFQIKHMGYRIELGEIENAIHALDGIVSCACVYDSEESKIVLFYQALNLTLQDIMNQAKQKLPNYMWPNKIITLDKMPHNANGKIDRVALKKRMQEEQ